MVQSKDEALRYQLSYGQSIILFNQNDDVFYKKSVDLSGHSVLTECRYQEVQPTPPPTKTAGNCTGKSTNTVTATSLTNERPNSG